MNQLYTFVEKAVDPSDIGPAWGYRVAYVFGTDAPDYQAFGDGDFDYGWNSSRDYGSAIPQLYLDIGYQDLTVRLGRFYTLIGYEGSPATDNFFYSHTYAFYYGEPSSHTGFLATYEACENWSLHAGWTMGWDSGFRNYLGASMFLGGVSWTVSEDVSVMWAVNAGDYGDGIGRNGLVSNHGDLFNHSILVELALTDRLAYVLVHELGDNHGLGADDNEWYSVQQYLTYEINDCWSTGLRFEWFRDDDGARVAVNRAQEGSYYATTLGLNWQPHPNVRVRPEVRWDWFDGTGLPFDGINGAGTSDQMFTGGMDVIVQF